MKKSIKSQKIIIWLCIIFTLFIIGLLILGLNHRKQMIIAINEESLQILANEKASHVNEFLEFQQNRLFVLSSLTVFRDVANDPHNLEKIRLAKEMIDELKDRIPGIGIFTTEGIIVVAENNPAGTDYSMLPIFPTNENTTTVFSRYYDQKRMKDYYGIGGPIYDKFDKNKVIGLIAFDIELDKVSSLMNETFDTKTNEVYLVDSNGLLLSASEYIGKGNKNGVLIQEINSEGARVCLEDIEEYQKDNIIEEHDEEVFKYENYMGKEVYGAHSYVPLIRGCVLAEKSVEEVSKFTLTGDIANMIKKEVKDE